MLIKIETNSYNDRRYGKPWVARVTAFASGKPEMEFGDWIGRSGDAGLLTIEAAPGDVLRQGQKDLRRPDKSDDCWYVVAADGSLTATTKVAAYELLSSPRIAEANPLANFSDDEILAEARRRKLVA